MRVLSSLIAGAAMILATQALNARDLSDSHGPVVRERAPVPDSRLRQQGQVVGTVIDEQTESRSRPPKYMFEEPISMP